MKKQVIHSEKAPKAIGSYSHAVRAGDTVYLSGQIGFNPETMELVEGLENQLRQIFKNIEMVAVAANAKLSDVVKLTVYLSDMVYFPKINEVMSEFFAVPYPARSAFAVKELPRKALVEVEAIIVT